MEYQALIFEKKNSIAIITLNRPESLNALNKKLSAEIGTAIEEVEKDDSLRAVVITGAGRAFCAGGDLKDLPLTPGDPVASKETLEGWHKTLVSIRQLEKPVIAAVNGVAMGGGMDLALICDIRIASENARFGESYVRIGGVPDGGGTYSLPRLIGTARACELLFTGDIINAQQAEALGLVNKVVPADKLISTALEMAAKIAGGSPLSIALIKRAIYMGDTQKIEEAFHYIALMTAICMESQDAKEGVAAFVEKRPPVFKGK